MIADKNGDRISPRQKAASLILERLGDWIPVDPQKEKGMTDREVALVDKQLEKMHRRMASYLEKAKKE